MGIKILDERDKQELQAAIESKLDESDKTELQAYIDSLEQSVQNLGASVATLNDKVKQKANNSGWTANKFLGTDVTGTIITVDNPMADVKDYIVASGSVAATSSGVTGTWYYEKYANGIAKCWGKFKRSAVAVNNAVGSSGWYRSAALGDHYPSNLFTAVTFADVKPAYWSSGSILDSQIYTIDGTAQVQWVARHTASNASMGFDYMINAMGTWK